MYVSEKDKGKGECMKPIRAVKLQQYKTVGILNKWLKEIIVS